MPITRRGFVLSLLFCVFAGDNFGTDFNFAADRMTPKLRIKHLARDFDIAELDSNEWKKAPEVLIGHYWSGERAPDGRRFSAKLLWSATALYVRFEANQAEPLIVSEKANLESKTRGLWDRDVCEIFIAPDRAVPSRYFEFEIAPNGEWIDLALHTMPNKRETDWEYRSGMTSAVRIESGKIIMAIKVAWAGLGKTPKTNDVWRGNLFRCVGKDPDRGYLAWQPTLTKSPGFHVPERFGELEFVK